MRFEHGSHRTECLAAHLTVVLLLLLLCCSSSSDDDVRPPSSHGTEPLRQCLPLDEGAEPRDACPRRRADTHVRLEFCTAYEPDRLLDCDRTALDTLHRMDEEARRTVDHFRRILDRYDCENANSVPWTCGECEEAYKQWVCAMFLPSVRLEGETDCLKPCRYICRLVEQRCPYFHPSVKEQYAGERVFKCIDPDIPDLDSIQGGSSYGPPHRCYCPKHLKPLDPSKGGAKDEEPECHLMSPAQLRRNASRWGQHRSRAPKTPWGPSAPLLATALLAAAWWTTRTR